MALKKNYPIFCVRHPSKIPNTFVEQISRTAFIVTHRDSSGHHDRLFIPSSDLTLLIKRLRQLRSTWSR